MRDYGKVHSSYWTSPTIRAMSEDGRTLAIYLLTCPHGTIAGVFRLPDGYACDDLQWAPERLAEGFAELSRKGFAMRCETTKWVWIAKHFEWNPPENPNQRKSAMKIAAKVPGDCCWKPDFMRDCGGFFGFAQEVVTNPSGTLSEPFPNQEQYQEQYQYQEQKQDIDIDSRAREPSSPPDDPPSVLGEVCRAIKGAGVTNINTQHPKLLAIVEAGGTADEFREASVEAVKRGKASFAYVLAMVANRREEAASMALLRGSMPERPRRKTLREERAETIATLTGASTDERTTATERDITGESRRLA